MSKDSLGDRMKDYEAQETHRRFLPQLPLYARIDGRGFSKFTRDMDRPYDIHMSRCMIETTKTLVKETHATVGFVQSDEISLVWIPGPNGVAWFDGKIMKMASVLAGLATASFVENVIQYFPNWMQLVLRLPHFDCRVLSMPSETEAANMVLWRSLDAAKNSISMAASHYYSHRELQNKSGRDKHEMLYAKGVNWNNYPAFFKRGTFVRKTNVERTLSSLELSAIPEKHHPPPDALVTRTEIQEFDLPPLARIINRADALFRGAEPKTMEQNRDDSQKHQDL
jgi:tRNA(His) 5'-end guanylyltransferase